MVYFFMSLFEIQKLLILFVLIFLEYSLGISNTHQSKLNLALIEFCGF